MKKRDDDDYPDWVLALIGLTIIFVFVISFIQVFHMVIWTLLR